MPTTKRQKRKTADKNPLWFHRGSGQWAKKIKGIRRYFGTDLESALALYNQERAAWEAGINPREEPSSSGAPTIADICNLYLGSQDSKVQSGELSRRTFEEQQATCKRLVSHFGRQRRVDSLRPPDFASLRAALASQYGPTRLSNEIVRVRTVFKWAFVNEVIESNVRYGTEFSKPKRDVIRRHRNSQPKKTLTASELRSVIETAGLPMKAFVLLGINCGYGAADIAILQRSSIDLNDGWIEHERAKTAVMRRCQLWPETTEALRRAMAEKPDPLNEADEGLAFLTRFGRPWLRVGPTGAKNDEVGKMFAKHLQSLGIKRPGVGFYVLRHLVQTIGEETGDLPAVASIMGHTDQTMADNYRILIKDDRLQAVTDYVRSWLFIRPERSRTKWRIVGGINARNWNGESWVSTAKDALTFAIEEDAKEYIAKNQKTLLADLYVFDDDEQPATIPLRRQTAG